MADLRYGIVTFKGAKVGTLTERPEGGTSFKYDVNSPEIACALPRSEDEHIYPTAIHPSFAHLAPEGWLRARQSSIADAGEGDDFGLLLEFGRDCIGAIGIEDPEGQGSRAAFIQGKDAETRAIASNHRTISGVQAKILCQKIDGQYVPADDTGPAPYIAKFPREDLSDLVGNEAISLELVQKLLPDDTVTKFERSFIKDIPQLGLLVERFDRIENSQGTEKLRCEDFAQILAHPPGRDRGNKYNVEYSSLKKALQYSAAPKIDIYRIFKRLIAFVILGNTDCHLKNWSLLETSSGLRLSPIYDVLNTYIYGAQGYSTIFGLKFKDQKHNWQEYDRKLLEEIGTAALELGDKAINRAFSEIESRQDALFTRLNQPLPLSEDRTYHYRAAIIEKWEQIYGS